MLVHLVVLLSFGADPASTELLKTFREEFLTITPGQGEFPPRLIIGKGILEPATSFAMAKYEVPQNLWEGVMGNNPSKWKGKRNSVEMFTYSQANAFCRRATEQMREAKLIEPNQIIRLPTETEWEFACRAGATTKYAFGDDDTKLDEFGWFHGNAAGNDPPVGAKKPNAYGLYDMHGYLWEFCLGRAIRGGSWKDNSEKLTCIARAVAPPEMEDDAIGLRCVLATQGTPLAQNEFVSPEAKFEVVWGEGEFTEGPALGSDGKMYFSDIGNIIYRFDTKSNETEIYRDPSGRSNGLVFDAKGRLYAAEGANTGGERRISITEVDGKVRTLADKFEGNRFNSPNDLAVDSAGNVYFTDPRYVGDEPRELDFEGVLFVSAKEEVRVATQAAKKPNGIVLSPDEKYCYVAENNPQGVRQLLKFKVVGDGTLADPQVIFDLGAGRGIDGMTIDPQGNLYATAGTAEKAGIYVIDPEGNLLAFVPTPGDPTNCEFGGGAEKKMLYVTTALPGTPTKYGLARITLKKAGR